MENNTSTYKEMYEGEMTVYPENYPQQEPEIQYDPLYWHGDISVSIENTNKMTKDVPTLTWNIPADKIGIDAYTDAAADFCLRAFSPYIDALNAELYNRSRPDMGLIFIGNENIDVRGLHDIITPGQLDSIGFMLRWLEVSSNTNMIDIKARINELYEKIEKDGLDFVYSGYFTTCERFLDLPRKSELLFVINRMRKTNYLFG